jgi:NIMA (never in mitosis gene a)-related kinase
LKSCWSTPRKVPPCTYSGDLATHVKLNYGNNPIPQDQLVKWLCQLCLSLHYLHNDMSILHRDIKTKNILVMGNGLLKIADFGTARQLKKNEEFAMTSVGTPYYLSPEAVKGPKYNSKSDIWGLGCIMFELCTGKKPFQGSNLNDLIKEILSSEIEEITEIYSEWLRNIIKSMLEKSP